MGVRYSNWQLSWNNQYVSYALLSWVGSIMMHFFSQPSQDGFSFFFFSQKLFFFFKSKNQNVLFFMRGKIWKTKLFCQNHNSWQVCNLYITLRKSVIHWMTSPAIHSSPYCHPPQCHSPTTSWNGTIYLLPYENIIAVIKITWQMWRYLHPSLSNTEWHPQQSILHHIATCHSSICTFSFHHIHMNLAGHLLLSVKKKYQDV